MLLSRANMPSGSDGVELCSPGELRRDRLGVDAARLTAFDLRHEDCVAGMAALPASIVDLVVTSPPYNLGIRYSKFSDRADRAGYLHWCKTWAAEIARLLKADGSFFLNVGASPANPMFPHQIVLELRDLFVLQNTIHWIKSISIEETRRQKSSRAVTSSQSVRNAF